MLKIINEDGNWTIEIDGIEYDFYYLNAQPLKGLYLAGLDKQLEEYVIGDKVITATKESYIYNRTGYRYILTIN